MGLLTGKSSLLVNRVTPLAGKTRSALASPAGEPPALQLAAFDQRVLAAPLQTCVAGVRRVSSGSRVSGRDCGNRAEERLSRPCALMSWLTIRRRLAAKLGRFMRSLLLVCDTMNGHR